MRELFKRYRNYFLAVLLLISVLLLYSYNLRHKTTTTFFERAVLTLVAPLQTGIDGIADSITGWWTRYLWLVETEQRNNELTEENSRLRAELLEVEEFRLQNERLRKLLTFVDTVDRPALPAQIIGEDSSNWSRTVTIDKGGRSGLRVGLPVVAAEGVVGRIIKTAPDSSRVLLVTDASSGVGALVQRSRSRGIVRGQGGGLRLDYVRQNADIVAGDLLLTSGMGGVFPKGLAIGRVDRVEEQSYGQFQKIEVTPLVDFSLLEEVMVLVGEEQ